MNKYLSLALVLFTALAGQAGSKRYNLVHFGVEYERGFWEKILASSSKTHSELIITPKIREDALLENDEIDIPDWDYESPFTKVIVFKKKSGLFSKAKDIKPVKYGLADSNDVLVCEPENTGTYIFTDEDIKYLDKVYDINVDKKNREALISYYQPMCMFDPNVKKRLIAFDNGGEVKVSAFKYDRDYYHYWLRKDYNWTNEIAAD